MGLSSADSPEDPGRGLGAPPFPPENPPRKEAEGQPCIHRVTRDGRMGSPGRAARGGRLWYGPLEPGWAQAHTHARLGLVRHFTFTGFFFVCFFFFLPFFSFNLKRQGRGRGGGLGREQQQGYFSLPVRQAGDRSRWGLRAPHSARPTTPALELPPGAST